MRVPTVTRLATQARTLRAISAEAPSPFCGPSERRKAVDQSVDITGPKDPQLITITNLELQPGASPSSDRNQISAVIIRVPAQISLNVMEFGSARSLAIGQPASARKPPPVLGTTRIPPRNENPSTPANFDPPRQGGISS
ncbi:hypothetical protein [Micromonospora wenchangensis]|uniref:hypothetical protein n=1 Tax=Micromonospora wenchangensis TaxID=1185415 RepID=UPI003D729D99